MSALHWICALTLALVCCLSAKPVTPHSDDKKWEKEIIFNKITSLTEFTKHNCPEDTEIYSPTDIHKDCLSSALNCAKQELTVLRYECNLTDFEDLYTGLERAENNTSPSPSSCNTCEMYPRKNVQQFLNAIQSLVERW